MLWRPMILIIAFRKLNWVKKLTEVWLNPVIHAKGKVQANSFLARLNSLTLISYALHMRRLSCPDWHHLCGLTSLLFLRNAYLVSGPLCPRRPVRHPLARVMPVILFISLKGECNISQEIYTLCQYFPFFNWNIHGNGEALFLFSMYYDAAAYVLRTTPKVLSVKKITFYGSVKL